MRKGDGDFAPLCASIDKHGVCLRLCWIRQRSLSLAQQSSAGDALPLPVSKLYLEGDNGSHSRPRLWVSLCIFLNGPKLDDDEDDTEIF